VQDARELGATDQVILPRDATASRSVTAPPAATRETPARQEPAAPHEPSARREPAAESAGLGRRRRRREHQTGHPDGAGNLEPDAADRVGQHHGRHSQAMHQRRSQLRESIPDHGLTSALPAQLIAVQNGQVQPASPKKFSLHPSKNNKI